MILLDPERAGPTGPTCLVQSHHIYSNKVPCSAAAGSCCSLWPLLLLLQLLIMNNKWLWSHLRVILEKKRCGAFISVCIMPSQAAPAVDTIADSDLLWWFIQIIHGWMDRWTDVKSLDVNFSQAMWKSRREVSVQDSRVCLPEVKARKQFTSEEREADPQPNVVGFVKFAGWQLTLFSPTHHYIFKSLMTACSRRVGL